MHLSGQLQDWSISDLLQIMQVTEKTGSLDIAGERQGRIHFRDGAVTGAELSGAKGTYVGSDRGGIADVLYVLSVLTDGSFSVGAADGPDGKGWSVEEVIEDVKALQSLEGEVIDAGLFEASGVRLIEEIDKALEITPEDWSVLVSLVQPFTFAHLESKLGRGAAVRVFHTLHRLGVADAMADEDESDWLDKLADEIAPESGQPTWLEHVSKDDASESEPAEDEASAGAPVDDEEPVVDAEPESEPVAQAVPELKVAEVTEPVDVTGVSAPASTMLTDGVYDEIRRLRSKVADS